MSDQNWPAPTPRNEMLARVTTRGKRIRAIRGAVNVMVILSVVGASALGVGAAIDGLGEGGTEVDNVVMPPEPPDGFPVSTSADPQTSEAPDTVSTAPGEPEDSVSGTTGVPGTTDSGGAETTGTTSGSDTGTSGSVTPGSTSSTRPTGSTSTSRPPTSSSSTTEPTTSEPTTTTTTTTRPVPSTTAVSRPRVGTMRMKVDGVVPTADLLCNVSTATVAVEIADAEEAILSWSQNGELKGETFMVAGASEWSAPVVPEVAEAVPDVPVHLTVTATGPGGVASETMKVEVADCTDRTGPDTSRWRTR